jgi:DNA-directed RNA polymerase subunit RPC12/RpoP
MDETIQCQCRECGSKDIKEVLRGIQGNPKIYLKCTKCGREFKKLEENNES